MLNLSDIAATGKRVFSRNTKSDQDIRKKFDGRHILIVEDEFFVGLDLAQTLESMGAHVSGPAANLAGAEEFLRDQDFDLVLLDVNLEGENTLELAARLKQEEVPVAFVTAYAGSASLFGPEHNGIPRLDKPTSRQDLVRVAGGLIN